MSLTASGAHAASNQTDYKALVCVFLNGGNDSFNTILSTRSSDWQAYTGVRNQLPDSIALLRDGTPDPSKPYGSPLALGGVLPLQGVDASQPPLALHPSLAPLVPLYNTQRRLAIVANVGTLAGPLSKTDYLVGKVARPRKLFSHNDQQSTWQSLAPEGATVGWGGRLADALLAGQQGNLFTAISVSGNALWPSGQAVRSYQIAPGGPIRMGLEQGMDALNAALLDVVVSTGPDSAVMARDLAAINRRSIEAERQLRSALPDPTQAPYGPDMPLLALRNEKGDMVCNPFAKALQTVGRLIASHPRLGIRRQVFFVSLGGFDTHAGQNARHAWLLAQLAHGLHYFDGLMQAQGLADKVTTFTASDFGRSFTSNGDGTDHGWGGHHFVMGGAVQGGKVWGKWPELTVKNTHNNDFDGSADQLTNGVLLPRLSVEQYGACLGTWFGASASTLGEIFPNLGRFDHAGLSLDPSALWRT
jgi:uncharacterized protein (DUF1501 family)